MLLRSTGMHFELATYSHCIERNEISTLHYLDALIHSFKNNNVSKCVQTSSPEWIFIETSHLRTNIIWSPTSHINIGCLHRAIKVTFVQLLQFLTPLLIFDNHFEWFIWLGTEHFQCNALDSVLNGCVHICCKVKKSDGLRSIQF